MSNPHHVVIGTAVFGLSLLLSPAAHAQAPGDPEPIEPAPVEPAPMEPAPIEQSGEPLPPAPAPQQPVVTEEPPPPRDWAVSVGIGTMEFTGSTPDEVSDIGASYEVRGVFGLHRLIGAEAAYIGSTQAINALGLDSDADLNSNGIEAVARLNLDRYVGFGVAGLRVSPFVLGGVAFQRFSLSYDGSNTSALADDDNVLAIPIGAGLDAVWQRVLVGARVTWRTTLDEDMFLAPDGDRDTSMAHWNLTVRAGYEF